MGSNSLFRIILVCFLITSSVVVGPNAALAQSTLIPLTTRRDMVFDHAGKYLYITTSDGFVRPYNLSTGQLETGYNLGGALNGADISPDDSFLLIAQNNTSGSQGMFQRLDLKTGAITNITYTKASGEGGGWDVAIGANGLALVTTDYPGSGWTPLRQIDLATNAITIRNDVPNSWPDPDGEIGQDTQIHRSADGTRMYFLESNSSDGPLFTYSATTNTFGPRVHTSTFLDIASAAVNRNGSLWGTRLAGKRASLDTAPDFNFVRVFNGLDSGVAFDAVKDTFYGVNSSTNQIIAYDTNTFAELFRLDIGEDVSSGSTLFGRGLLVASQDGNYLALATTSGIRIFAISNGVPFPSPTPTFGTPRDMVFDHAGQHLYITTTEGLVWPYNLSASALETPYNVGGSLNGVDIAPDDSFLLMAQYATGVAQGTFQKLDLQTGAVTNVTYMKASSAESGGWDVAIGSNGLALVTTDYNGSGSTPLRQIDLATNTITIRADAPGSSPGSTVGQETDIYRSADGTRMYFLEGNSSSGPIFTYSATTNTFGPSAQTNSYSFSASAAVDRNGSLLGTHLFNSPAYLSTAPDFNFVHSFNGLDSGVAFDAVKDIFYGVNSSTNQVIAYNTNTFTELFRFNIGEDVNVGSTPFGPGLLMASQDGHYLAFHTSTAIRVYTVPPPVQLVSVASVKTHGNAGIFNINLPLSGARGIECRSGGTSGDYTMVFTFGVNLASVDGASITNGTGTVSSNSIDNSDSHRYIVSLTGVTDAQYIKVTLSNVSDSAGNHSDSLSQEMGVLIGDLNGDGVVNVGDTTLVRGNAGVTLDNTNFRYDVSADGFVNIGDTAIVKSKSGDFLAGAPSSALKSSQLREHIPPPPL